MINTQILDEAAEWFVTLRDGEVDAAARAEFAAWLCKSPEHVRAYLELTSTWAEAASVDAQRTLDAQALIARARAGGNVVALEEQVLAHRSEKAPAENANVTVPSPVRERAEVRSSARRTVRRSRLYAASAAVACLAGAVLWQMNRAPTYATGIGEQRSITLADGSRVELNARSRIRIKFSEKERLVELLEGQSLFRVARNPQRPFIVRSADAHVRAVGTQFDVYRKPEGTVVTVLEGKVEVRSAASGSSAAAEPSLSMVEPQIASQTLAAVELAAGEQAIVAADRIARPKAANIAVATAWMQQQLVFDSASLADVAREFNRYNLRQLVIRDAQLREFLISGVFSSTDPASLLRFLEAQPGFIVEETDTEIRITRK